MVGSGRAAVAEVCDISRANVADGAKHETLLGLSSLGGFGKYESNQERDLHRWVKGLHAMTLEPFEVTMLLNVSCSKFWTKCCGSTSINISNW
jgi:hypothetical protein